MTMDDTWKWDSERGVYFHPASNTYALPDRTKSGEWVYTPASEFAQVPDRKMGGKRRRDGDGGKDEKDEEKEEGEIEESEDGEEQEPAHVGWGGLMNEDELAAATQSKKKAQTTSRNSMTPAEPTFGEWLGPGRGIEADTDPDAPRPSASATAPPGTALRLVVNTSPTLSVGGVIIVDSREEGVQIGRDRCERGAPARIRVKEMEVSKTHAVVYWGKGKSEEEDEDEGETAKDGWWIVDLGSTQGTFVASAPEASTPSSSKPHRLSKAKHSSVPYPIRHLSTITIGLTSFIAHVHPSWPCDECRLDDNEIALDDGTESKLDTSQRLGLDGDHKLSIPLGGGAGNALAKALHGKKELLALRGRLLDEDEAGRRTLPSREYLDRSAQRRRLHPPSPPSRGTRTPEPTPLPARRDGPTGVNGTLGVDEVRTYTPPQSIGQTLLAGQGWVEGSKLGKSGDGLSKPLIVNVRPERSGLGASGSKGDEVGVNGEGGVGVVGKVDWKERGKMRRFEQMRDGN